MAAARGYDEMTRGDGTTRAAYERIAKWLADAPKDMLASRQSHAD